MNKKKLCSSCFYFDYDEIWNGEEEIQLFECHKGHSDHIDFNVDGCEDWREMNYEYLHTEY